MKNFTKALIAFSFIALIGATVHAGSMKAGEQAKPFCTVRADNGAKVDVPSWQVQPSGEEIKASSANDSGADSKK
jgi:hypothetical protein